MIVIYTDGSCLTNPGNGGWAAIINENNELKKISGSEKNTTNNRMELMAPIYALKQINDSLYLYMNEVEILISEILKEAFEAKLKKEKGFLGSFVFVNENRIKLIKIVR